MDTLTPKQEEIYNIIKDSILKKGYPPSVREIGELVGLKSTSSVHAQLNTLEKKGYIRKDPSKPRTIEITDDEFNKTLAANIYDLLKNQFFMDATIGKKSNKIIQEFLKDYKKSKKKIKEERIKFYESFIENIGDDYLHDTLSNMLMKLKNIDFKARMKKEFEEKIMYYQEQIKRMERNNEKN